MAWEKSVEVGQLGFSSAEEVMMLLSHETHLQVNLKPLVTIQITMHGANSPVLIRYIEGLPGTTQLLTLADFTSAYTCTMLILCIAMPASGNVECFNVRTPFPLVI